MPMSVCLWEACPTTWQTHRSSSLLTVLLRYAPFFFTTHRSSLLQMIDANERVFVGGLPYYLTEDQCRELLGSFGAIKSFDLVKDRETGNSKGWAVFSKHDGMWCYCTLLPYCIFFDLVKDRKTGNYVWPCQRQANRQPAVATGWSSVLPLDFSFASPLTLSKTGEQATPKGKCFFISMMWCFATWLLFRKPFGADKDRETGNSKGWALLQ